MFAGVAMFAKKHRRSPSHYNLKYGRENSPPDSPVRDSHIATISAMEVENKAELEVCNNLHTKL